MIVDYKKIQLIYNNIREWNSNVLKLRIKDFLYGLGAVFHFFHSVIGDTQVTIIIKQMFSASVLITL